MKRKFLSAVRIADTFMFCQILWWFGLGSTGHKSATSIHLILFEN